MVKYLLEKGADPGTREGLAIEIAVKLGDLRIVKMLVEASTNGGSSVEGGVMIPAKWVEAAVKSGSDEIVSYFVHEKGMSNSRPVGGNC
jgi:ankyrin repeat protein